MKAIKSARLGLLFAVVLLIAAAVATLESFQAAQATGSESAAVTYSRGTLRMNIPYDLPRAGAGQLAVEVLDPEDQVLGRSEWPRRCACGKGMPGRRTSKLSKVVGTDDLAWDQLRYHFPLIDESEGFGQRGY